MQVEIRHVPASAEHSGTRIYFFSGHCRDGFNQNLDRYLTGTSESTREQFLRSVVDPICGMTVDPAGAVDRRTVDARTYYFCSIGCSGAFDRQQAGHSGEAISLRPRRNP